MTIEDVLEGRAACVVVCGDSAEVVRELLARAVDQHDRRRAEEEET